MRVHVFILAVVGLVAGASLATAQIQTGPAPQRVADTYMAGGPGVQVASVVTGLEVPWSLAFLPDGRWVVSERPGRIRLVVGGQLRPAPLATLDEIPEEWRSGAVWQRCYSETPNVPLVRRV